MMPKDIYINRVCNNENINNNFNDINVLKRNRNEYNDITSDRLLLPSKSFLKPASPLILKRSSLIKYDDSFIVTDDFYDNSNKPREIIVYPVERTVKSPSCSLFNTGSISSLKNSSLNEEWPSSNYIQSDRLKTKAKIHSVDHGFSIPTMMSNDNFGINPVVIANQPMISASLELDTSFSKDQSILSSCLSNCDSVSKFAATDIMKQMDFTDLSLVESLQIFVRKIPVVGESQERDRILTNFTDRFMACNPNAFRNNDCCHTLICALMLLNTDIHGQVSKKRMTSKEFVDNLLSNYPDSGFIENDLVAMYNYIRKTELKYEEISDNAATLRHKFSRLITRSIKSSSESNSVIIDPNLLNQQHFISGNIMRKCIRRSFGKKPALGHRGWKLQFASLIGLQLLLFKTNLNKNDGRTDHNDCNSDRISLTDSNISSEMLHNDDSSLCLSINNSAPKSIISRLPSSCSRDTVPVSIEDVEVCIKIHHAFCSVVEKLRHKNVFSLRLADQAEYFFKVKSDQLQKWINNINYAAAILSAPPIVGAGQCGVYKPLLPGYLTDLDKKMQMQSHDQQIRCYRESMNKLERVNCKSRSTNDPQIQFCKYEVTRFEAYLRLLRPPSMDECRSAQLIRRSDPLALPPAPLDPPLASLPQTPRSAFLSPRHHTCPDVDPATLRRRPPAVPKAPPAPLQMSPTADSLHSCVMPPRHAWLARRPVTYSPQIGGPSRPAPPFSRFIDPTYSESSYRLSPVTVGRAQTCGQPTVTASTSTTALPVNILPKYSPPSSTRRNTSKIGGL